MRLPRRRQRRATQPERSGDGGAPGGPTRPQKLRLMHGMGRGHVLLDLQGRYRGGHVQYCRPLQMTVYCTYRSSRRPPVDAGWIASRAIHAADAMSPTRTQALSSAGKELEPFPFERNVACYSLSRPTTHGCHVPLTAWDPRKVPEFAGVCAVRLFVQRRYGWESSQHEGRVVVLLTTPKPRDCPCCDGSTGINTRHRVTRRCLWVLPPSNEKTQHVVQVVRWTCRCSTFPACYVAR